mmetsp:Transcript_35801/g.93935  ORF Transcript_35801/g.93935 Transcript_35801/m.93935 type:complete len:95 (-) Transcript_35801:496-780(-)
MRISNVKTHQRKTIQINTNTQINLHLFVTMSSRPWWLVGTIAIAHHTVHEEYIQHSKNKKNADVHFHTAPYPTSKIQLYVCAHAHRRVQQALQV